MIDQKIIEISMEMIMYSGDGRNLLQQALDFICEDEYEKASKLIKEATEKIRAAHILQTEIVQSEFSNIDKPLSIKPLLFSHAQDTLMTINSELLMTKKLHKLFKSVDRKIKGMTNENLT